MRQHLCNRRNSEVFDLRHDGQEFAVGISRYHIGQLAEVFGSNKAGSAVEHIARDASILASLCLQHGVTAEELRDALTRHKDGSACGIIGAALDKLAAGIEAGR